MPSVVKSKIVVLHLTKFSDSGIVLHAVDSESGRRSFLVRGIKRGNATAAFHPLNLLDVVSGENPKSSLSHLREWNSDIPLHGIRGDRIKSSVAMFVSEVLYRSLTNEMNDDRLFGWLCDLVAALDSAEGSVANFPLWFLVSYATRLGFMPGEPLEPAGLFSPEETTILFKILGSSYAEAMAIPLSAARRQAFARKMLRYLSWHLGTTVDAKSLDVLHAVLQDDSDAQ